MSPWQRRRSPPLLTLLSSLMQCIDFSVLTMSLIVCRLCLKNNNLLSLSAEPESFNQMQDMIYISTGVQILKTDKVSQMICTSCYSIIQTMCKFRSTALKNDGFLQMRKKNKVEIKRYITPNSPKNIEEPLDKIQEHESKEENNSVTFPSSSSSSIFGNTVKLHPSVIQVFENNKCLLPYEVLNVDVLPNTVLDKLNPEEMKKHIEINDFTEKRTTDRTVFKSSQIRRELEEDSPEASLLDASSSIPENVGNIEDFNKSDNFNTGKRMKLSINQESTKDQLVTVEKSVEIYICKYCNAVFYLLKHLKYHQRKIHMKCQFCKASFRSFHAKKLHIKTVCENYQAINNIYKVELVPVEIDVYVRERYPSAFTILNSLKNCDIKETNLEKARMHFPKKDISIEYEDLHLSGLLRNYSIDQTLNNMYHKKIEIKHEDSYNSSPSKNRCNVEEQSSQTGSFGNENILIKSENEVVFKMLRHELNKHVVTILLQYGNFCVTAEAKTKTSDSESFLWNDEYIIEIPLKTLRRLQQMIISTES